MDHTLYRPEDFACDESYLRFYFRLDEKDIVYWEHWIRTHPEKLDVIMSADQLIGFLSLQLPEEEFQHEYERFTKVITKAALLENTRAAARRGMESGPVQELAPANKRRTGLWLILASIVLVAGAAWWFEFRKGGRQRSPVQQQSPPLHTDTAGAHSRDTSLRDNKK